MHFPLFGLLKLFAQALLPVIAHAWQFKKSTRVPQKLFFFVFIYSINGVNEHKKRTI
jgi:hypothetical protein